MSRLFLFIALSLAPLMVFAEEDAGPPISITSPDKGTTFAFGTIKNHTLIWSHDALIARIIFTDEELTTTQPQEDIHEFRLPGITFDPAKGLFYAKTAKGDIIPVAQIKKTLFLKSIETLPNAHVRVIHPNGIISVVLEAISPNDPAMHPPPRSDDPDASHTVDAGSILR